MVAFGLDRTGRQWAEAYFEYLGNQHAATALPCALLSRLGLSGKCMGGGSDGGGSLTEEANEKTRVKEAAAAKREAVMREGPQRFTAPNCSLLASAQVGTIHFLCK